MSALLSAPAGVERKASWRLGPSTSHIASLLTARSRNMLTSTRTQTRRGLSRARAQVLTLSSNYGRLAYELYLAFWVHLHSYRRIEPYASVILPLWHRRPRSILILALSAAHELPPSLPPAIHVFRCPHVRAPRGPSMAIPGIAKTQSHSRRRWMGKREGTRYGRGGWGVVGRVGRGLVRMARDQPRCALA